MTSTTGKIIKGYWPVKAISTFGYTRKKKLVRNMQLHKFVELPKIGNAFAIAFLVSANKGEFSIFWYGSL